MAAADVAGLEKSPSRHECRLRSLRDFKPVEGVQIAVSRERVMSSIIAPDKPALPETRLTRSHARELLEEYGSPLYVYDAQALRATIEQISYPVNYPRNRFSFASATNGNRPPLRMLREHN